MTTDNERSQTTRPCPMPDEVCADCGYRCGDVVPVAAEDMFYGGAYWVWDVPGLGLRVATPGECATEIKRLREVIAAAFDEIDDSPDEARMILKHSGAINNVQS